MKTRDHLSAALVAAAFTAAPAAAQYTTQGSTAETGGTAGNATSAEAARPDSGMGRPGSSIGAGAPLPDAMLRTDRCQEYSGDQRRECLREEQQRASRGPTPTSPGAGSTGMGTSSGSSGAGVGGNTSAPTPR